MSGTEHLGDPQGLRHVLVTGGAGFIGSHVADRLLLEQPDVHVTVIDNLSTGSLDNVAALKDHSRFTFVHGSVLDEVLMDELIRASDFVVHLAAAVGVELVMRQPLRSFLTNIRGTEIVLAAAHRYRCGVLLASTSEVYGKNYSAPLTEDADRVLGSIRTTRWSYSVSKSVDEILAHAYHLERGVHTTVVRLFNTVGPRQSPAYGMVIPRLVRQAVTGVPLTVHGDGGQSRCFLHVGDAVDALVRLISHPAAVGEVFNVGSDEEITITDLAHLVLERTGSTSPVRYIPYAEAYGDGFEDMRRRVPDTTKLRRATGWAPSRSLVQVIDDVIAEVDPSLLLTS